jgi:hypothetical protein
MSAVKTMRDTTVNPGAWLGRLACVLLLTLSLPVWAASLVDDATLIGSPATPVQRDFQIAQDGRYELRLTDVGFPARLQSLQAAVTRGDALIASAKQPGVVLFDAVAGRYSVQVAGITAASSGLGSFAVRVAPASGGTAVLDDSDTIETPTAMPVGRTTGSTQFTVAAAGTYRVTISDTQFPEKLQTLSVLVTRGGVEYMRLDATRLTDQFTATAGTYDVLMTAQAGTTTVAGLYTVRVASTAGTVVLDDSYPVGNLGAGRDVQLPAAAPYTLSVTDAQFPTPLLAGYAAVMRGSTVAAVRKAIGSVSFNSTAGAARIYALPVPNAQTGVGALLVETLQGTSRVFSGAFPASPSAASGKLALFAYEATLKSAASHRAVLTDFALPTALSSVEMAVYENSAALGRRSGAGPIDFQGAVGSLQVLVAAQSNPSALLGLFGVQVSTEPTGPVVLDNTGALGGALQSLPITIKTGGSYDVRLSDLEFPTRFAELDLAVTRGTARVGSIFGSGKLTFVATPGTYFVNIVSRVNSTSQFGSYGLRAEDTPVAPTVTLTASATSIASGGSSVLAWSSTGATSCAASGAWSGTKAITGTQTVGPLTTDSKFTLSCTGPGGTSASDVTVRIKGQKGSGGGGTSDGAILGCLAALAALARRRAAMQR